MPNITDLRKEFTVGWDFIQSGLPLKMWKEAQERQNGLFGNYYYIVIEGIVAFSTAPLAIASLIGMLMLFIAVIFIIFIIIKTLIFNDPTSGWPSLVCIITLIGGIQIFCTGILGQYLSKTYLETKKRPVYIVKDTNIEDEKTK